MTETTIADLAQKAGELWSRPGMLLLYRSKDAPAATREALSQLQGLLADHPGLTAKWGDVDFYLGKAYEALDDYAGAARHYETAATCPQGVYVHSATQMNIPGAIHHRLGNARVMLEQYEAAFEQLEIALEKGTGNPAAAHRACGSLAAAELGQRLADSFKTPETLMTSVVWLHRAARHFLAALELLSDEDERVDIRERLQNLQVYFTMLRPFGLV